jgi:hypothetical protein
MSVQQKAPLSLEQAQGILETLTLLVTPTHQKSKLIFYDSRIGLEADSSTWRTLSSLTASVKYYGGYEVQPETRELAALPPLMEKVDLMFRQQKLDDLSYGELKSKCELIENAEKGLVSLKVNSYQSQDEKAQIIETALKTLQKTKKLYQKKSDESRQRHLGAIQSKGRQELEQKDQEIARLKDEIEKKTGEIWRIAKSTYEPELAKKNQIIAAQALADPIDLSAVPTAVILERIQVLVGVVRDRTK